MDADEKEHSIHESCTPKYSQGPLSFGKLNRLQKDRAISYTGRDLQPVRAKSSIAESSDEE